MFGVHVFPYFAVKVFDDGIPAIVCICFVPLQTWQVFSILSLKPM